MRQRPLAVGTAVIESIGSSMGSISIGSMTVSSAGGAGVGPGVTVVSSPGGAATGLAQIPPLSVPDRDHCHSNV